MCDNGKEKWCCPNTEICSTIAGECTKSDGMCSYIFSDPQMTKTYDCAYTFKKPVVTKTYDCAYTFKKPTVTQSYDCSYEIKRVTKQGIDTLEIKAVKACDNPNLYCNLQYSDQTCGTTADSTSDNTILYGACSPASGTHTECKTAVNSDYVLQVQTACPSSMYCHLKYQDTSCTQASSNTTGVLYGVCLEPSSVNAVCPIPSN